MALLDILYYLELKKNITPEHVLIV